MNINLERQGKMNQWLWLPEKSLLKRLHTEEEGKRHGSIQLWSHTTCTRRFNIGENKALKEQTPHNYWKV